MSVCIVVTDAISKSLLFVIVIESHHFNVTLRATGHRIRDFQAGLLYRAERGYFLAGVLLSSECCLYNVILGITVVLIVNERVKYSSIRRILLLLDFAQLC